MPSSPLFDGGFLPSSSYFVGASRGARSVFSYLNGNYEDKQSSWSWFSEWSAESNAWREALWGGNEVLDALAVFFSALVFYAATYIVAKMWSRKSGVMAAALRSRPLLINATIHGTAMWAIAVVLTAKGSGEDFWQKMMLPQSIAYYTLDMILYAVPRGDALIVVHHAVMIFMHFPLTGAESSRLMGAGDALWAVRLSVLGYACAELCVPVLNMRWLASFCHRSASKKLDEVSLAAQHWNRFFHAISVIAFAFRVFALSSLLIGGILPRAPEYLTAHQPFTFLFASLGIFGTLAISVFWLVKVITIGATSMNSGLIEKCEGEGGGYVLEVWHGRGLMEHLTQTNAGYLTHIKDPATMIACMERAKKEMLWPFYCVSCLGFSVIGVSMFFLHANGFADMAKLNDAWPLLLPWWAEACMLLVQGVLSYAGDVEMEFKKRRMLSKWYLFDRLSASVCLVHTGMKFSVLSPLPLLHLPRDWANWLPILLGGAALACYGKEAAYLEKRDLYPAMRWHTLWHTLAFVSYLIWLYRACVAEGIVY